MGYEHHFHFLWRKKVMKTMLAAWVVMLSLVSNVFGQQQQMFDSFGLGLLPEVWQAHVPPGNFGGMLEIRSPVRDDGIPYGEVRLQNGAGIRTVMQFENSDVFFCFSRADHGLKDEIRVKLRRTEDDGNSHILPHPLRSSVDIVFDSRTRTVRVETYMKPKDNDKPKEVKKVDMPVDWPFDSWIVSTIKDDGKSIVVGVGTCNGQKDVHKNRQKILDGIVECLNVKLNTASFGAGSICFSNRPLVDKERTGDGFGQRPTESFISDIFITGPKPKPGKKPKNIQLGQRAKQ